MLNTKLTKELLSRNKKMLMALNQLFGINFEKTFIINKLDGAFTINKALKETGADPTTQKVIFLVESGNKYRTENKLYTVEVTGTGTNDFDNELARNCKNYYYYSGLDNCYKKAIFNDERKTAKSVYIIAQGKENLSRCYKEPKPDFNERFTPEEIKIINNKRSWVCYGSKSPLDFDKSGYQVTDKRNNLIYRASVLRKERAKQEFKESNNSTTLEWIKQEINGLKTLIIESMKKAETYKEYYNIYDLFSPWRGFLDVVRDFENLEEGEKNKTFASMADFEKRKNYILETIRKIKGGF